MSCSSGHRRRGRAPPGWHPLTFSRLIDPGLELADAGTARRQGYTADHCAVALGQVVLASGVFYLAPPNTSAERNVELRGRIALGILCSIPL